VVLLALLWAGAVQVSGCVSPDDAETSRVETRRTAVDRTEVERAERVKPLVEVPGYDPRAVQPEDAPPLSEEEVRRVVDIALSNGRVAEFVGRHDPEVAEVRKLSRAYFREAGYGRYRPSAVVTVDFGKPVPPAEDRYPLAMCDIGGHSENVTGVVWMVDLKEGRVSAVSPHWDYEVACGY
jgi:hypothetical protein